MSSKTMLLGTIGDKLKVHYRKDVNLIELLQADDHAIGSMQPHAVRKLAMSDSRWQVALALYDLHVDWGSIIA